MVCPACGMAFKKGGEQHQWSQQILEEVCSLTQRMTEPGELPQLSSQSGWSMQQQQHDHSKFWGKVLEGALGVF